jgi:hypothetical protein
MPVRARADHRTKEGKPTWGICPECRRDRRVNADEQMVPHNRWEPTYQQMVICDGSYRLPARITTFKTTRRLSAREELRAAAKSAAS